jgi:transcriptional regulator with XRE-family HTH domain
MPKINPTIMAWARKSAGLSIEDAADKIGLHASRGISGAERLLALEEGTQLPTRQILLKMSKQYRRPLLHEQATEAMISARCHSSKLGRRMSSWILSYAMFAPGKAWCDQYWKMPAKRTLCRLLHQPNSAIV